MCEKKNLGLFLYPLMSRCVLVEFTLKHKRWMHTLISKKTKERKLKSEEKSYDKTSWRNGHFHHKFTQYTNFKAPHNDRCLHSLSWFKFLKNYKSTLDNQRVAKGKDTDFCFVLINLPIKFNVIKKNAFFQNFPFFFFVLKWKSTWVYSLSSFNCLYETKDKAT